MGCELAVLDGSSSDSDDPRPQSIRKSNSKKLKSGRSRTSEDVVKHQVDWPHFNVFKGAARSAADYDSLTIPEFLCGYLGNLLKSDVTHHTQLSMLEHLCEPMHDATMFPWEGVLNYHGIVLRLMEHDEVSWTDKPLIQELRTQYARTPGQAISRPSSYSAPSRPRSRACLCPEFKKGACTQAYDHESPQGGRLAHIWGWCYRVHRKQFQHAERDCYTKQKRASKNDRRESDS